MEPGSSYTWQETLRLAIGENRLDASAVREYFRPLEEWLKNENLRTGEFVGWVYGKCQLIDFSLLKKISASIVVNYSMNFYGVVIGLI